MPSSRVPAIAASGCRGFRPDRGFCRRAVDARCVPPAQYPRTPACRQAGLRSRQARRSAPPPRRNRRPGTGLCLPRPRAAGATASPPATRQRGPDRPRGRKVGADRFERPFVDPRPLGKPLGEQFAVVDHEFEAFRGPADLDVEQVLVGPAASLKNCDHPGARHSLGSVHGGAVSMVDVAELGIIPGNRTGPAVVHPEPDTALADLDHCRLLAVDEIRRWLPAEARRRRFAVAGPADPVAGANLDLTGVVQPQVARGVARGPEPARLAVRVGEFDLTTVHAVHAGHGAGVVGGASVGVAMEHDDIAGLVALGIGCFHPGQPLVDQALDHQRLAMKDAFVQEAFAHRLVDVPADQVGGRKHCRAFPLHLREGEPALRRGPSELIRRRLAHPVAQARDRCLQDRPPGRR